MKQNQEIKIENNVPMPSADFSKSRYPFRSMNVGDSFFAPGKTVGLMSGYAKLLRPLKFTGRTREENGVKGVRIWRIA